MSRADRARAPEFSIGGVLGKGFAIWGRSLATLLVLMIIIYSPLILFQIIRIAGGSVSEITGGFGFMQPAFWIERLLSVLSTAAVIYTVFQRLRGARAGIGDSLRACMSRFLPVVGAAILVSLVTAGPLVPGILVFRANPPAAIALFLLGLAATIYLSLMLWVAIPSVVVENLGSVDSLKRSASLTHGHKGQIFVIMLVAVVVAFVGGVIGGLTATLLAAGPETLVIVQLFVTLLAGALAATMIAVGYHDLRQAKEGIGVEDLLKVFA
jgi:hypothetical protein